MHTRRLSTAQVFIWRQAHFDDVHFEDYALAQLYKLPGLHPGFPITKVERGDDHVVVTLDLSRVRGLDTAAAQVFFAVRMEEYPYLGSRHPASNPTSARVAGHKLHVAAWRFIPVVNESEAGSCGCPIFADYEGHRTCALYFAPSRVEIVDGPLKCNSYNTPSGAASAVVRQYNPAVACNRDGWIFWQLADGRGALQCIRPHA